MGNEFEEGEIKEKEPVDNSDRYFKYGIVSKKGGERGIEDTFISYSDLESLEECKKRIHFGLFGVFDGHNNDYVSKYLSDNCYKVFQKEAGDIDKEKPEKKMEDIFKIIDKKLRNESQKKDDNNIIKDINIGVDDKEIKFYKDLIQNTKEIPDDVKNVEDSQIKDLLLFKNLFKYNNNYLYSNDDTDYIGSSASLVLINNDNIITADLGITASILFDLKGNILKKKNNKDNTDNKDLLKPEHVFENKQEKKRIKKFNESVEYENLKLNIYVPASRCFGLFKYKADEILKEENQIISCIPEVNCFKKDSVDFILLMTKGMINLFKDNINDLVKKITEEFKKPDEEVKISEILDRCITEKIKELEEKEKIEKNNENKKDNKDKNILPSVKTNSIYVGKEDFGEENEIINELKKNYFKDIMDFNKNSCYYCQDKFNITCILIKINKGVEYPIIEVKIEEDKKMEGDKPIKKEKNKEEKKEEKKEEEKKDEIDKNEIKELDIEKEKEEKNDKKDEENIIEKKVDEENKEEIIEVEKKEKEKENKEEKKEEEKKEEEKKEEEKDNKIEIIEEEKKEKENKEEKIEEQKNENKEDNGENKMKKEENTIMEEKINDKNIGEDNNRIEDNKINIDEENKKKEENKIQEIQNKTENNMNIIEEEKKSKEENKEEEQADNKEN